MWIDLWGQWRWKSHVSHSAASHNVHVKGNAKWRWEVSSWGGEVLTAQKDKVKIQEAVGSWWELWDATKRIIFWIISFCCSADIILPRFTSKQGQGLFYLEVASQLLLPTLHVASAPAHEQSTAESYSFVLSPHSESQHCNKKRKKREIHKIREIHHILLIADSERYAIHVIPDSTSSCKSTTARKLEGCNANKIQSLWPRSSRYVLAAQ